MSASGTPIRVVPVRFAAVLVMAGDGRRLGAAVPKAFVELAGRPLWMHAADTLVAARGCAGLVLVAPPDDVEDVFDAAEAHGFETFAVTRGGARRQDSVRSGLELVREEAEVVAIHDAARPLVTVEVVEAAVAAAASSGASLAAARARDTLKEVDGTRVVATPDRARFWHAQTPQCFRRELILRAHAEAERKGWDVTDDAMLVERLGERVEVVEAGFWNLKVTVPEDLVAAEALLLERARAEESGV